MPMTSQNTTLQPPTGVNRLDLYSVCLYYTVHVYCLVQVQSGSNGIRKTLEGMSHREDKVQDFQSIGSTTDPQVTSTPKKENIGSFLQVVSDNTVSTSDEYKSSKPSNSCVAVLKNCDIISGKEIVNDAYISDLLQRRMKSEQGGKAVVKQNPAKFKYNGFVLAKAVLNLRDLYDIQCGERNTRITSPTSPNSQILKKQFVNAQKLPVLKEQKHDTAKDMVLKAIMPPVLKDQQPIKIKVEPPQPEASNSVLSKEIPTEFIDTNSLIVHEDGTAPSDTQNKKYSYKQPNLESISPKKKQAIHFKCRYSNCEFTSIREQNVNFHIARVHEAKQKDFPFFCKICRIGYYMKGLLTEHTLRKHESPSTSASGVKSKRRKRVLYTLPEYDKPLEQLNDFKLRKSRRKINNMRKIQHKYHKRLNRVINCSTFEYAKRTYKCKATNCQWSTRSGTLMFRHILKHRSEVKPIECQQCSIEFRCHDWLRKHLIKYHKRLSKNHHKNIYQKC